MNPFVSNKLDPASVVVGGFNSKHTHILNMFTVFLIPRDTKHKHINNA